MFGLGMPVILMILAIALIVVGHKKMTVLAKTLGRAMGEFKRSAQDFKNSLDVDTTVKDIKDITQDNDVATSTIEDNTDCHNTKTDISTNNIDSSDHINSIDRLDNTDDIDDSLKNQNLDDGENLNQQNNNNSNNK
jgi:Sec-independent protein translocase protein TatA